MMHHDSCEIVDGPAPLSGGLGAGSIGGHVQAVQRERDGSVELGADKRGETKTLEVDA
jgi:hypothetical protein